MLYPLSRGAGVYVPFACSYSMQHRPMFPQPLASGNGIPTINIRMARMESRTMVHMCKMRDFMRYGRAAHEYRRADKSPAIANIAIGSTTSPTRTRITHRSEERRVGKKGGS